MRVYVCKLCSMNASETYRPCMEYALLECGDSQAASDVAKQRGSGLMQPGWC